MSAARFRWCPKGRDTRGSALLVAVIFTSLLGALIIPSYLVLSNSALKLAHRSFYNTAALDLAESGLEHAMWVLNQPADGTDPWEDWELMEGTDVRAEFSGFSFNGEIAGTVRVAVVNYRSKTPEIVSRAVIDLGNGQTVEKWMHATLRTGRSLFSYGMLARDHITSSGGAWFDSWISDPDKDPATPHVPYSSSVARDNAKVASASNDLGAISLGSSDLYGTVAVGSESEYGLEVSWGGQVGPRGMTGDGPRIVAPGAISTKFTATFEDVIAPATDATLPPYRLPRNVNGPPYYISQESIGSPGATTSIELDSLRVEGAATLTIEGDVTLVLPASGDTVLVGGSGKIRLAPDATLTVYTAGNIKIAGAGIANPAASQNFQVWGTAPITQKIEILGSGQFSGVIYAPNADLRVPGHADIYGAVVANRITMAGSGAFHYDESLADLTLSSEATPPAIDNVRELVTAESRAPHRNLLR